MSLGRLKLLEMAPKNSFWGLLLSRYSTAGMDKFLLTDFGIFSAITVEPNGMFFLLALRASIDSSHTQISPLELNLCDLVDPTAQKVFSFSQHLLEVWQRVVAACPRHVLDLRNSNSLIYVLGPMTVPWRGNLGVFFSRRKVVLEEVKLSLTNI